MKTVNGHLEIHDKGFGFLRSIDDNFEPVPDDVFVPTGLIQQFGLLEGSFISGTGAEGDGRNQNLRLSGIDTVNGVSPEENADIEQLRNRVSINPNERLVMTRSSKDLMGMALDTVVPIGKGQRGLIVSPPKSGKTTIMRHMANAIVENDPDVTVFALLVDERPEEVTDFKRGLVGAHVLHSSADQSISRHMRITRIAVHTAIRCAEAGGDAVVFIDSLTRMSRAFNINTDSRGRTMSGGLGVNALAVPRKIFGAARNVEGGGSLTIIATILVETGSRMDDIIYQEFKGTGNMDLVLSRKCAEQRVFPSININASGTRKEALLFDDAQYQKALEIRRGLSDLDEVKAMSEFLEYLDRNS